MSAEEPGPPHYQVIDLGTLPHATFSQAYGLNEQRDVAGDAVTADGNVHAFFWSLRDGMKDLGTLGGANSFGSAINDRGAVAISSEVVSLDPLGENFCGFGTGHICIAAVWRNGTMQPLPNLKTGNNSQALGLNQHGYVVGYSETGVLDDSCSTGTPNQVQRFEAVTLKDDHIARVLRPLPGDTVTFALSINNRGQAVGSSGTCANTPMLPLQIGPHAVLWERDGTPVDLGGLGPGTTYNTGASINDLGEVTGGAYTADNKTIHTFLWTRERGMRDLGTVGTDLASIPGGMGGINNHSQIVGQSCNANPLIAQTPPACRAYLWHHRQMVDLNSLIPADSSLHLTFAFGINDAGAITGFGTEKTTGDTHAFLFIPCRREQVLYPVPT